MAPSDYNFLSDNDYDYVPDKYVFKNEKDTTKLDYQLTPVFAYDYIDLDETDYCFSQKCIDYEDILAYFKKVKNYSKTTVQDLVNKLHHSEHFHLLSNPPYKLRELIKRISGRSDLKDEHLPMIGQFGLYTNINADRTKNIKSPRIFFFIGYNAVLYILFYDPYHEIFNASKKI